MESKSNYFELNLKDILKALIHKSWLILLVTLIFAAGAGYYSENYLQPYYISSTKLYIINRQPGDLTTLYDLQTGTSLAKDYMILIKSRPVMEEVISKLNLKMTSSELAGAVSVSNPMDTRVLQISVISYDPDMAKKLADTIAEVSSEKMVSIMGMEKVNIVEEGNYPYAPSGPDFRKNIILAGGIGLLGSSFVIILIYLLNDSIKTAEDIDKYLGITTLGLIPMEYSMKKNMNKQKRNGKKAA